MAETKSEAGVLNIVMEQGTTFARTLTITQDGSPLDLRATTGRLQVRTSEDAASGVIDLTNGSGLTMNNGSIDIEFEPSDTSSLDPGNYVYGLEYETAAGAVYPLLKGRFRILPKMPKEAS